MTSRGSARCPGVPEGAGEEVQRLSAAPRRSDDHGEQQRLRVAPRPQVTTSMCVLESVETLELIAIDRVKSSG